MNIERAREIARLALRNLEANRQRIDDLNVYPVPDGDTGTNMALTLESVVARTPPLLLTIAWALMAFAVLIEQGTGNAFIYFQF